jgi:hypothetical protein
MTEKPVRRPAAGRLRPLAMEVVGPAGSGKSSVARALAERGDRLVSAARLADRVSRVAAALSATRVVVPFVAQLGRFPSRPWYRCHIMVQLQSHAEMLDRWNDAEAVALLDQGPVYLLSILQRALRRDGRDSRHFLRFWNGMLDHWAKALGLVVVLDAPDEVLYQRVQARGTPHPLLRRGPEAGPRAIAAGRRGRELILGELCARNPSLIVERLDTHSLDAAALAERIARRIEGMLASTGGGA